jgi:hypothetical protein
MVSRTVRELVAAISCAFGLFALGLSSVATADPDQTPSPASASAPAMPSISLATVMAKYVDVSGGRNRLSKIQTVIAVSSFTLFGRVIDVTTTTKTPSSFLQVVQPEGSSTGKITVGFDGTNAWTVGPDGVMHLLTGQKRAEVIADAAGANNSEIFPERWPTTVSLKPNEDVDGKSYYVLSILAKGGVEHDILLDTQTYLPIIERRVEPDSSSITIINEFGKGPLGELISKSATTTSSDFPRITSTLQSVRDNVTVEKSIFAPPLGKGTETI